MDNWHLLFILMDVFGAVLSGWLFYKTVDPLYRLIFTFFVFSIVINVVTSATLEQTFLTQGGSTHWIAADAAILYTMITRFRVAERAMNYITCFFKTHKN